MNHSSRKENPDFRFRRVKRGKIHKIRQQAVRRFLSI